MAAHLPGMCAAIFPLPVIGVPIHTKTLSGVDSLYSIVQMPSGIPVATVAIDGAQNAGILAAEKIKQEKPEGEIIFLTAHETKEMIVTAMGVGAIDYLVKGSPEDEVLHHIRCAYEGHPVMESKVHETVMQEYARLRKSEQSLLFFITNLSQLTGAERQMIKLFLQGYKTTEIAKIRCVEYSTVKTQVKSLLRKFGCSRTTEIVNMIQELNIGHLF